MAELSLDTEKLRRDFDDVWGVVPHIKGKVEDIELNTDVLILGVNDIKDQIKELSERERDIEKNFKDASNDYSDRFQTIRADIGKLTATVESNRQTYESLLKSTEDKVEKEVNMLRDIINKTSSQVELLQKNIDSMAANVKSLQKVVEMTDNNALLKQVDALNLKIVNLNVALEQLRGAMPDTSSLANDINLLNGKIQNIQMNVMDVKNDLAEKEKRLTLSEVEIEKIKTASRNSFDQINERLKEQEEKFIKAKNLDVLATFGVEARKRTKEIESAKLQVEAMFKSMQKMYYEFNRKMYELASLRTEVIKIKEELGKLKFAAEKPRKDSQMDAFTQLIEETRKSIAIPDKSLVDILERIKLIEEKIALMDVSGKMKTPVVIE
ncbi:MAG: hypothetical protein QXM68_00055 [Candidatus Aenigmatarchaeota archaeon]|nr:hypothetical protein [Candidatus Aenigmarchaeota archaeon]